MKILMRPWVPPLERGEKEEYGMVESGSDVTKKRRGSGGRK